MTAEVSDGERLATWLGGAKLVFFDCDGVVYDSNAFKSATFERVLAAYGEAEVAHLVAYHRANGGVSRYEKLDWFLRRHHPEAEVPRRLQEACERFTRHSRRAYAEISPVPEALRLVQHLGPSRCLVVSGSDQEELRDVFRAAGLLGYFSDVLGSPTGKVAHLRNCLRASGLRPDDTVFIGDGSGDLRACQEVGVPMIFLEQMSDWSDARESLRGSPNVAIVDTWSRVLAEVGLVE